jgi:hypothetical protein
LISEHWLNENGKPNQEAEKPHKGKILNNKISGQKYNRE